jgi:UDPglucose 6-dehydrogenase
VQALHRSGQAEDYEFGILTSVMAANELQKTVLFDPIRDYFGGDLKGKRIALWGLAFKPETDDIREAPALYMIDRLVEAGAEVVAFDPEAMDNIKGRIGDKIEYTENHMDALDNADALLICTEWQVFRNPDLNDVKKRLNAPVVFDGRNLYELESMKALNFYYKSIGRSTVHPV